MENNILDDLSKPKNQSSNGTTCLVIAFFLSLVFLYALYTLGTMMGCPEPVKPKPQQSEASSKNN